MKVIVTKNLDGTESITTPAPAMFDVNSLDRIELAAKGILVNAGENEILEWIKNKDAPLGVITEI